MARMEFAPSGDRWYPLRIAELSVEQQMTRVVTRRRAQTLLSGKC